MTSAPPEHAPSASPDRPGGPADRPAQRGSHDATGRRSHDATGRRSHYTVTFAVLALSALSYCLLQSMVTPALPLIQRDLNTSTSGVAWIMTGFLLSASVFTPIVGRLGDMFGKERMLVAVLVVLGIGTALAAVAPSIAILIVARLLQGAAGAIFPLAFGIIRDEFPPAKVAGGMGLISAAIGVGSGVGIVLAGPVVNALNYHWLFWFPLMLTGIAIVATVLFVPESPVKTPGKINWLGATLLSAWLVSLLLGVSEAPDWGWVSPGVLGLFVAAVVFFVGWVRAESRSANPLIDIQTMRRKAVWTTNATALLFGLGMYSTFVLLPGFVETPSSNGYGFSADLTGAGLYILPQTVTVLITGLVAGRLTHLLGAKGLLTAAAAVATAGFAMMTFAHSASWEIWVANGLIGVGVGGGFAAMPNLIVAAVPPEQTGAATGMNTNVRTIGGSLGSQIVASILAGSTLATGFPTEHAYTLGFGVATIGMFGSVLAALQVPGRPAGPRGRTRRSWALQPAEAG